MNRDYYKEARSAAGKAAVPEPPEDDGSPESAERRVIAKQAALAVKRTLSINRHNDSPATLQHWREACRLMNGATEKSEKLIKGAAQPGEEWAAAAAGFREAKAAIERRIAYLEGRASAGK